MRAAGFDPDRTASLDLAAEHCRIFRSGEQILDGTGAAVMGSPLHSVAWLANRLGAYGITLDADDVILPGALAPFAPIAAGDRFKAEFATPGAVEIGFD